MINFSIRWDWGKCSGKTLKMWGSGRTVHISKFSAVGAFLIQKESFIQEFSGSEAVACAKGGLCPSVLLWEKIFDFMKIVRECWSTKDSLADRRDAQCSVVKTYSRLSISRLFAVVLHISGGDWRVLGSRASWFFFQGQVMARIGCVWRLGVSKPQIKLQFAQATCWGDKPNKVFFLPPLHTFFFFFPSSPTRSLNLFSRSLSFVKPLITNVDIILSLIILLLLISSVSLLSLSHWIKHMDTDVSEKKLGDDENVEK